MDRIHLKSYLFSGVHSLVNNQLQTYLLIYYQQKMLSIGRSPNFLAFLPGAKHLYYSELKLLVLLHLNEKILQLVHQHDLVIMNQYISSLCSLMHRYYTL